MAIAKKKAVKKETLATKKSSKKTEATKAPLNTAKKRVSGIR